MARTSRSPLVAPYGLLTIHDDLRKLAPGDTVAGAEARARLLRLQALHMLREYAVQQMPAQGEPMALLAAHCLNIMRATRQAAVTRAELDAQYDALEHAAFALNPPVNLKRLIPVVQPPDDIFKAHVLPVFDSVAATLPADRLVETLDTTTRASAALLDTYLAAEVQAFAALVPSGWRPAVEERADQTSAEADRAAASSAAVPTSVLVATYARALQCTVRSPIHDTLVEYLKSRLRTLGVAHAELRTIAAAATTGPATTESLLADAGVTAAQLTGEAGPATTAPSVQATFRRALDRVGSLFALSPLAATPAAAAATASGAGVPRPGYEPVEEMRPLTFSEWQAAVRQDNGLSAEAWMRSGRVPRDWLAWPSATAVGVGRVGAWLCIYSDQEWYNLGVRAIDVHTWGLRSAVDVLNDCGARWDGRRACALFELADPYRIFS